MRVLEPALKVKQLAISAKTLKGFQNLFVPDLEVNRLLLDGKISKQLFEVIPRIDEKLDSISYRRLEVIMTGAIRTQVRLNSAGIKDPQGLEFSRICPHCALEKEETAEHILWECSLCNDIRAETKQHDQIFE